MGAMLDQAQYRSPDGMNGGARGIEADLWRNEVASATRSITDPNTHVPSIHSKFRDSVMIAT